MAHNLVVLAKNINAYHSRQGNDDSKTALCCDNVVAAAGDKFGVEYSVLVE